MTDIYLQVFFWSIAGLALIYFISGIDEILVDLVFVIWRVFRRVVFMRRHRQLLERDLMAEAEQPAAILVPAWQEARVIGQMLRRNVQTLRYANYHIFVGLYPNDPETLRAVQDAQAYHANIHAVLVGHDGPTNKADCLNAVIDAVGSFEREHGVRFEIFVVNDAEDVAPALELKIFNHLIPRKDIVQLPVFPIPVRWWQFTGGHYMDEFAHQHLRDLRVREWLTGSIPTAGVGCGFSRRCIDVARASGNGHAFSTDSVTEDYEFSLKLSAAGLGEVFFDGIVRADRDYASGMRWADQVPAVTEAFPKTFWTSVRQKTRWILGIALQGWSHLGWRGGFLGCYMLFRDRKVLVTSLAVIFGYVLVLAMLMYWGMQAMLHGNPEFPNLVPADSWVWSLLFANFAFMLVQLSTRAIAVFIIYGPLHALLSVPRAVWGNAINATATIRAISQYVAAKRRRQIPAWDKTHHEYPNPAE